MKKKFKTPESVKNEVQAWASHYSKVIVSWEQMPGFLVATFDKYDLLSSFTLRELTHILGSNILIGIEDGALQLSFPFNRK